MFLSSIQSVTMPRKYLRKRPKLDHSLVSQCLQTMHSENLSLTAAAKRYNLNKRTVHCNAPEKKILRTHT